MKRNWDKEESAESPPQSPIETTSIATNPANKMAASIGLTTVVPPNVDVREVFTYKTVHIDAISDPSKFVIALLPPVESTAEKVGSEPARRRITKRNSLVRQQEQGLLNNKSSGIAMFDLLRRQKSDQTPIEDDAKVDDDTDTNSSSGSSVAFEHDTLYPAEDDIAHDDEEHEQLPVLNEETVASVTEEPPLALEKPSDDDATHTKLDVRLQGDFSLWSVGPKLSCRGIKAAYVGMHRTLLSHDHDGHGGLKQVYRTSHIQSTHGKTTTDESAAAVEAAAHPIPLKASTIASSNNASSSYLMSAIGNFLKPGIPENTAGSSTQPPHTTESDTAQQQAFHSPGYYCVHLLECVIRPDVELKNIMTVVYSTAAEYSCKCVFPQKNHAVLLKTSARPKSMTRVPSFPGSPTSMEESSSSKFALDYDLLQDTRLNTNSLLSLAASTELMVYSQLNFEWDLIDAQVCLSKELKQRVLVVQFFAKVENFQRIPGFQGYIISQLTPDVMPLAKFPKTKRFVHSLKVSAPRCA